MEQVGYFAVAVWEMHLFSFCMYKVELNELKINVITTMCFASGLHCWSLPVSRYVCWRRVYPWGCESPLQQSVSFFFQHHWSTYSYEEGTSSHIIRHKHKQTNSNRILRWGCLCFRLQEETVAGPVLVKMFWMFS